MSYLEAPATKLLATHCAVCRKALVDAVSVESGMGPDCRRKYLKPEEGAPEHRAQANKLVYLVAAKQEGPEVLEAVSAVAALGFKTLADILIKRLAKVRITVEGSTLLLKSPYSETAVPLLARVPGRRWDKERKLNTFPVSSRGKLWDALKAGYNGVIAHGPNGFFTIGASASTTLPVVNEDEAAAKHAPVLDRYTAVAVETALLERGHTSMTTEATPQLHPDERYMMEMDAKADREQTEREERAKHEARGAQSARGSLQQIRRKFKADLYRS
jgi:hypothetical protein